jgi:hypothetical protein
VIPVAVIVVALASLVSFAGDIASLRYARRGEYAADAVALAAARPGWSSTLHDALERAWNVRIDGIASASDTMPATHMDDAFGARVDVTVRNPSGTYTASAVAHTLDVTPDDTVTAP